MTYVIVAIVWIVANTFVFLPKMSFVAEEYKLAPHPNMESSQLMVDLNASDKNVGVERDLGESASHAAVENESSRAPENDKYSSGMKYEFNANLFVLRDWEVGSGNIVQLCQPFSQLTFKFAMC